MFEISLIRFTKSTDPYQISLGIKYQEIDSTVIRSVKLPDLTLDGIYAYTDEIDIGCGDAVDHSETIIPIDKIENIIRLCKGKLRAYYMLMSRNDIKPMRHEFIDRINVISNAHFILKLKRDNYNSDNDDNVFVVVRKCG